MDKDLFVAYSEYIESSDWIIGIDVAHGGLIDGEYQTAPKKMWNHSDFTFYEGVFSRSVGIYLSNILLEEDISHYFTTDSNLDVSLSLRTNRVNNFINKYPKKGHFLLSIHGNAYPKDLSVHGIEVITQPKDILSEGYGKIMNESLKEMGWKMRSMKKKNLHMNRESICPSVLLELGFFTNEAQARAMSEPQTQEKLAQLIANGIKNVIR